LVRFVRQILPVLSPPAKAGASGPKGVEAMASTYDVRGKAVLVTCGASGIGEACVLVLALARGGANVLIADLKRRAG
jgi:hypothetical protein